MRKVDILGVKFDNIDIVEAVEHAVRVMDARSGAYMLDYIRRANQAGMPVTVDIFVDHRGRWDEAQFEALKYVGDHL